MADSELTTSEENLATQEKRCCIFCKIEKPLFEFERGKVAYRLRCKSCYGLGNRTCRTCGNIFPGGNKIRYCSAECKKAGRPQNFRNCGQCGILFGPIGRLSVKFCSQECNAKSQIGRPSPMLGIKRPDQQRAETRACDLCGSSFRAMNDFHSRKQRYCSKACWSIRASSLPVSEKGPGIRKTAAYRAWRKSVLERDNSTCQFCGYKKESGKSIRLHVDHIKPFCLFPELRMDLNNGRVLCEPCHRSTPTWGWGARQENKDHINDEEDAA